MPDDSKRRLRPQPVLLHDDDARSHSTVLLFDRQIAFLDRLVAELASRTGHHVTSAEVVRALLDAVIWSGVDETLIAAMYGSEREQVPFEAEITAPDASVRTSAERLRDALVQLLRE
jgi:hypothetical protein